LVYPAGLDT